MTIYLAIITTVLVITQVIRVTQLISARAWLCPECKRKIKQMMGEEVNENVYCQHE